MLGTSSYHARQAMKPKDKDENAKDPRRKVPVDLPHVEPGDYPEPAPRRKPHPIETNERGL